MNSNRHAELLRSAQVGTGCRWIPPSTDDPEPDPECYDPEVARALFSSRTRSDGVLEKTLGSLSIMRERP